MNNQFAKLFEVGNHQVLVTNSNETQNGKFIFKVETHINENEFKLKFGFDTKKEIEEEFLSFDESQAVELIDSLNP